MPPAQQPYYQGPGWPNTYGAPPSPMPPPQQQQQQQRTADGYPIGQPFSYGYGAVPPPACTAPSSLLPLPPGQVAAQRSSSPSASNASPHGLPPALYPPCVNNDNMEGDSRGGLRPQAGLAKTNEAPTLDSPPYQNAEGGFDNPSCHPKPMGNDSPIGGAAKQVDARPQYGPPKASYSPPESS
ncbi:hypothetical protein ABL78_8420 [Leptomonas seymouri]|uniref:Uncharacterized protein n=1 Tax=Leptomonas seymouri TaxID=5684 RepID=A0A0N1PAN9_LEPSE|nr:hypothetical protein ABL78_8420 [Leptomonas seymouri]|eukprot:KPI82570.1 hypothetical protein ABL78_8420 [Leptomonas seymouri]